MRSLGMIGHAVEENLALYLRQCVRGDLRAPGGLHVFAPDTEDACLAPWSPASVCEKGGLERQYKNIRLDLKSVVAASGPL
jgi:hypothetical protein